MAPNDKTLIVIGAGPGIGRAVTIHFATKRYGNVALIARRSKQLDLEQMAIEAAVGAGVNVKTHALDVTDYDARGKALSDIEDSFGQPQCVFYNAARVQNSKLLAHDVKDIEYEFKINVCALYTAVQQELPRLVDLARRDKNAWPSIIVTSSMLPEHPITGMFSLCLAKAAQRNLMQSLDMTYAKEGVHLGLINVGGPVSPDHETWNPTNVASKAWEWLEKSRDDPTFEVVIRLDLCINSLT